MAEEEVSEENRQFEQVLSRLDALMKRSQGQVEVQEPPVAVPVLTELYLGGALTPVEVAGQGQPPELTELVTAVLESDAAPDDAPIEAIAIEAVAIEEEVAPAAFDALPDTEPEATPPEASASLPALDAEGIDAILAELTPRLREMIARVAQEEFFYAQQNLMLRVGQEAEQMLRLRLLQETKPK